MLPMTREWVAKAESDHDGACEALRSRKKSRRDRSAVRLSLEGGGGDHFHTDITPCIEPQGSLDILLAGGKGADVFDVTLTMEPRDDTPSRMCCNLPKAPPSPLPPNRMARCDSPSREAPATTS